MRGLSEPKGSWKMNCSLVRKRLSSSPCSASTSVLRPQSSNTMRPPSVVASAEMPRIRILLSVVLPQPDSPTRPRHSPRSTSKLTSLTARMVRVVPPPMSCSNKVSALRMRKVLERWRTLSTGASGLNEVVGGAGAGRAAAHGLLEQGAGFGEAEGLGEMADLEPRGVGIEGGGGGRGRLPLEEMAGRGGDLGDRPQPLARHVEARHGVQQGL